MAEVRARVTPASHDSVNSSMCSQEDLAGRSWRRGEEELGVLPLMVEQKRVLYVACQ
jgi:hypothetical protein